VVGWICTACSIRRATRWLMLLAVRRLKMVWGRRRGDDTIVADNERWSLSCPNPTDLGRCRTAFEQHATIVARLIEHAVQIQPATYRTLVTTLA